MGILEKTERFTDREHFIYFFFTLAEKVPLCRETQL